MYRKILDRDLDFMTASRLKSWRKTTGTNTVEMDTVRNTFKSINYSDIPATDHDALVRLYLRKTTFNNQNHKIYPNRATRPDWAHRLNCWSCETYKGQFHIETLDHAINSCPCLENIRKIPLVCLDSLVMPLNRPLPPTALCGDIFTGPVPVKASATFWGTYLTISSRLKS